MSFFKIEDFDFKDKRVLIRVDFNVHFEEGELTDDSRIKASIPTFRAILDKEPKYIAVLSHLGRPKGRVVDELRLDKIALRLSKLLDMQVEKLGSVVGDEVEKTLAESSDGRILMLENVQFEPGETQNSDDYAKQLASYADVFVFDAFGQAHRRYASICGIQKFVPSCAGLLMEKELKEISKALNPERPFAAIVGGAKADKIFVIERLEKEADVLLFGGVLANTFLLASGKHIGISRFDPTTKDLAVDLLAKADHPVLLPIDAVVAERFTRDAQTMVVDINNIPDHSMVLDIGPKTVDLYKQELAKAKTIIWIGPIGAFEIEQFSHGTRELAEFLSNLDATVIIGGGDSAAAVISFGLAEKMTHVSTGGGASLAMIGGKKLPAVEGLEKSYELFKNSN
jgi:phosphoglycerate kinase